MEKRHVLIAFLGAILFCGLGSDVNAQLIKKPGSKKKQPAKTTEPDPNASAQPDKILYDRALEDIKHARYTEGRLSLQTLINTYPDSEYLAKAKLAVADSYYKESGTSNLTQAVAEYKDFITFFPFLDEAAYAQMQVGMAHYKMMEKSDRDSSQAQMAEDEFQAMLLKYPQSTYAPQAEQRLREVQEVLADGEYKIAHFYYTKQDYRASAARLLEVINRYPLYSESDEALWMLGDIYTRVKTGAKNEDQRNYWAALSGKVYAQIVEQYPLSPRAQEAKTRLKEMGQPIPAANPDAIIRMQKERDYEKQHRENALLKRPKDMLHTAPDVSTAAHVGQPNLNPPDDVVAASEVLKPNSGVGAFNLQGSADSNATDSSGGGSSAPIKQEDAVTQGTVEVGPAGGRTLGVQIITPPDANASGNGAATPTAPAQTAPSGAQPGDGSTNSTQAQPNGNTPDAGGNAAPTSNGSAGAASSANSGSQPANGQSATESSSSNSSTSPTDSSQAAPSQSSSTDDSKDSSSKKKKGVKKLIPW